MLYSCTQDTASYVEPAAKQPAPRLEASSAEASAPEQTSPAQAVSPDADDDFGPTFEFH